MYLLNAKNRYTIYITYRCRALLFSQRNKGELIKGELVKQVMFRVNSVTFICKTF